MHLVYHEKYDLNLGAHVFPSTKFRLIRDELLRLGEFSAGDILRPEPASREDLLLVHEAGWIDRLLSGRLGAAELRRLEIPWSKEMAEGFVLAAGGSILAARTALREGVCFNIGGGFHHAFAAHGEGFCAINDVAVAIRALQREGAIERAMVVDCDVHHGNGTASIFAKDESVFTLSIQQLHNYPAVKPQSNLDIHLEDETGDEEYLARLEEGLKPALAEFRPELAMYVAGSDPYFDDQLGGLNLTMEGLRKRDEMVISMGLKAGAAVAIVLAGGYARKLTDTVAIHCQSAVIGRKMLKCGV